MGNHGVSEDFIFHIFFLDTVFGRDEQDRYLAFGYFTRSFVNLLCFSFFFFFFPFTSCSNMFN